MSGLAGVFYLDGRPAQVQEVAAMTGVMAHRGPDGIGHWAQGPVALGHLQLCTTPESLRERQPLVSDDGCYAIAWDGRVDNRQELISALWPLAPVSQDATDVELVLHAYRAWGEECLKRIVGDFAFALWDGVRQRLFCARDPMGIKTLFYYYDGNRFIFASDIRAILVNGGVPRQLNQLMVGFYLLGRLNEAEQTFFQGIFQLLPANYLVVEKQGLRKETFWEPDPWNQIRYREPEEYVEHFRQVFFQAVQCRLRSVSPVGISLSGGMDSTSVACTAAALLRDGKCPGGELRSFSSVFRDFPDADERGYIQTVLEASEIQGTFIEADDLWGFKPLRNTSIVWNQPYPVPFKARHETLLSRARESGVRVMLTGEGGDEMLSPGFAYLLDLLRGLRWKRLYREVSCLTPSSRAHFFKLAFWLFVPRPVREVYGRLRSPRVPRWLNQGFIEASGALEHEPVPPPPRKASLYCRIQYDGGINLPRMPFLPYATEMYQYHQLEARHPFLDLRLVDFLSRVPPQLKLSRGWSKLLLRMGMEGILPEGVRRRVGKSHFLDLTVRGMHQEKEWIEASIARGYLVQQGWVNIDSLEASYHSFLAGDLTTATLLLEFLTLEEWLTFHFGSNGVAPQANARSPGFPYTELKKEVTQHEPAPVSAP